MHIEVLDRRGFNVDGFDVLDLHLANHLTGVILRRFQDSNERSVARRTIRSERAH